MTEPLSSPVTGAFALIDERLADLREANDVFRTHSRDWSNNIQRNDREIRWLTDLRSVLVLRRPAQLPASPGTAGTVAAEIVRQARQIYETHDDDGAWVAMESAYLTLITKALRGRHAQTQSNAAPANHGTIPSDGSATVGDDRESMEARLDEGHRHRIAGPPTITAQETLPDGEDTKLVYVKRWRTLVKLPAKYTDEIVEALRSPAIPPIPSTPTAQETRQREANHKLAKWLSAALGDQNVCAEMKADIESWFEANTEPWPDGPALPSTPSAPAPTLTMIADKAREWAGHYDPHSDGRNTFVMFAEWVEGLSVTSSPSAPGGQQAVKLDPLPTDRYAVDDPWSRPAARYIWPAGCHSPNSCHRNGRCMYVGCKHDGTDAMVTAVTSTDGGGK